MMSKRLGLLLVLLVMVLGTLAIAPASANSRGELVISPSIGTVTKKYPAINGVKPSTPTTPYAQVRNCRDGQANSQHCDAIDLIVQVPDNYKPLYAVKVSLNWVPGPAANDVTMWIFDFEGQTGSGGADIPADCCGPTIAGDTAANKPPPRSAELGEPQSGKYYISIVNMKPGNTGYTLTAEWLLVTLGKGYGPAPRPGGTTKREQTVTTPPKSSAGITPVSDLPPGASETDEVKVPGADGELVDMNLPVLAQSAEKKKGGLSPIVPLAIAVIVLGGATFGYFMIRRRKLAEEVPEQPAY